MNFTQEPTSRNEHDLTDVVDKVARRLVPELDKFSPVQQAKIKEGILPVVVATLNWADEQPHRAMRGDDVEAWIKCHRDQQPEESHDAWPAVDSLLDDYRLHADVGAPLDQEVHEGPSDGTSS